MPTRASKNVSVRALAPEAAEEIPAGLLYRPVPQLKIDPKRPPFKVSYEWISPEQAAELLVEASQADNFRQRPLSPPDVDRWASLLRTDRFVHYLPNGVICFDEHGVQLNGQHRFNGMVKAGKPAGYVVFRHVPRWMFAYFDTGKRRTIKNVLHINNRPAGAQTDSAMKLALRYEEFIQGIRPGTGWRHWNAVKDEHQDVDDFYGRRAEIQDGYRTAARVYGRAKILIPSVLTFQFYQSLAWPEGADAVDDFLDEDLMNTALATQRPAQQLRKYTLDVFAHKTPVIAKRELHLMLLMNVFALEMKQSRISSIQWAYGQPMAMPYHPKGHEVAIKNVRSALDELDRAATPDSQ